MAANNFNTDIPDSVITDILARVDDINTLLAPYEVALDETLKKRLPKIADETLPFAEKVDKYMDTEPKYNPNFIDVTETHKDFANFRKVHTVISKVNVLKQKLTNITIAAGSDAITQYLGYYGSVKKASEQGIPGAKAIFDDLKIFFTQKSKKNPTPPTS